MIDRGAAIPAGPQLAYNKHDMKIIYTTERLYTREMTMSDLPALAAIMQDPEAMRAYEGPFSDEEILEWLKRLNGGSMRPKPPPVAANTHLMYSGQRKCFPSFAIPILHQ